MESSYKMEKNKSDLVNQSSSEIVTRENTDDTKKLDQWMEQREKIR